MKYKDAVSYECKCGRELVVSFPSMQKSPSMAPSIEELKTADYCLTQEIIYHQNKQCPVMHQERKKAMLATAPHSMVLPPNHRLI